MNKTVGGLKNQN